MEGRGEAHPGMSSHITAQNWRHADTPSQMAEPFLPLGQGLLSTSTLGIRNSREPLLGYPELEAVSLSEEEDC